MWRCGETGGGNDWTPLWSVTKWRTKKMSELRAPEKEEKERRWLALANAECWTWPLMNGFSFPPIFFLVHNISCLFPAMCHDMDGYVIIISYILDIWKLNSFLTDWLTAGQCSSCEKTKRVGMKTCSAKTKEDGTGLDPVFAFFNQLRDDLFHIYAVVHI